MCNRGTNGNIGELFLKVSNTHAEHLVLTDQHLGFRLVESTLISASKNPLAAITTN